MFSISLLPLPPPSTSLLPALSQSATEPAHQAQHQHPPSRRKHSSRLSTPLTTLAHDERLFTSRKLAIAMYGYSWLKPAGCNKTMLGRREEDLEREEVERQLREVELQERMAAEQEEQERRGDLERQAEGGEVEGIGERDLDDDVPEAVDIEEGEGTEDDGDDLEDGDVEEDMEGDLDDDVPDADADGLESSWVYDTRRESDTESEEEDAFTDEQDDPRIPPAHDFRAIRDEQLQRGLAHAAASARAETQRHLASRDDLAAAEAVVEAMLDEDELGEYEHQADHDLDDDVPDMDADMDMDMDANLSDDVPSAEGSPGWEHTDSELEESEMDISLLPPHPSSTSRNPGTTHEEMRRVSGNRMLPPPLPSPSQSHAQEPQRWPRTAPRRNLRAMMQTPATEDEVSALISTGGTSVVGPRTGTGPVNTTTAAATISTTNDSVEARSPNRRNWLNPAGARRNLFGGFRTGTSTQPQTQPQVQTNSQAQLQAQSQIQSRMSRTTAVAASSGGLFTPSPRHLGSSDEEEEQAAEPPQSRTRSGRLLGSLQVGRRTRRGRDGET